MIGWGRRQIYRPSYRKWRYDLLNYLVNGEPFRRYQRLTPMRASGVIEYAKPPHYDGRFCPTVESLSFLRHGPCYIDIREPYGWAAYEEEGDRVLMEATLEIIAHPERFFRVQRFGDVFILVR